MDNLAQFNQDTRDSVRGTNNYNPCRPDQGGEWPGPPNDFTEDRLRFEDAQDYS